MLSEVSPPTALSPFAAAAITGGDPYKTTLQSWKYTMPAFLVPFMFVLDPAGLGRIRGYVGKASSWPTWMHAARAVAENNADVYPHWEIGEWLAMAKRIYRLNSSGRIVLDYDMKIAEPFRVPGNEAGPDMWQAFAALSKVPTLIVRGARSDVLAPATAERMLSALDHGELVTVPHVGHTPTLDEPEAVAAIDRLLARVEAELVAA